MIKGYKTDGTKEANSDTSTSVDDKEEQKQLFLAAIAKQTKVRTFISNI